MRISTLLSRLKDVAVGATRTSVRVATPVVSAATATVRERIQRRAQPVPHAATSAPTAPVRGPVPSPAGVARNIAPHPPAPASGTAPPSAPSSTAEPARPASVPGAKLPPRRRTDD